MKKIILVMCVIFAVSAVVCGCSKANDIGEEKARELALADAGLVADEVTFIKSSLEFDDGKKLYNVEFYTPDYTEYDYEINAESGKIISKDKDIADFRPPVTNNIAEPSEPDNNPISEQDAKQIALKKVPGSNDSNFREFRLEYDDGIKVYEGKLIFEKTEYEFRINASTGEIMEWESESVWD